MEVEEKVGGGELSGHEIAPEFDHFGAGLLESFCDLT